MKAYPSASSPFLSFLLPSIPFRRRRTSTQSAPRAGRANESSDSAGEVEDKYLHGHISYLRCARCAADICLTSQIISKGFTGRHGRAYLVSADPLSTPISVTPAAPSPATSLPNTMLQRAVPRQLVTGAHTVSDISCVFCGSVLGWKYVAAEDESQRYKVGKFILETKRISTSVCWENDFSDRSPFSTSPPIASSDDGGFDSLESPVEFDSQDEDECEDLFAGVWSPNLAIRRRSRKFDAQREVS
jgi:hypothetical protein